MLSPDELAKAIAEDVAAGLQTRRGSVTGTERWAAQEGAALAFQTVELDRIATEEAEAQAAADRRARLGAAHTCPSCGQLDQAAG